MVGVSILLAGIFILVGGYLFLRPQSYKEEMGRIGHLFGEFPLWAISALGVFLSVFSVCLSYLFLTEKNESLPKTL